MNDKANSVDYKNISLIITGEISSGCINRNNLTQPTKELTVSFMDNMEDDDEQFILNLKRNIDENCKIQNKENFSTKDLQDKSYLLKKKKSAFSDEDQKLVKRFKKCVDENKAQNITPQTLQKSENINHFNSHNSLMPTTTPLFTSAVALNDIDMNLRSDPFLFHMISKMQKNNQIKTPVNDNRMTTVIETETEQLLYCEMHYLTPPQNID